MCCPWAPPLRKARPSSSPMKSSVESPKINSHRPLCTFDEREWRSIVAQTRNISRRRRRRREFRKDYSREAGRRAHRVYKSRQIIPDAAVDVLHPADRPTRRRKSLWDISRFVYSKLPSQDVAGGSVSVTSCVEDSADGGDGIRARIRQGAREGRTKECRVTTAYFARDVVRRGDRAKV